MQESPLFFHHLEWPAPGARVAGPVVWLRGWVTGKPGFNFTDVRVSCATGIHLGVLGLPRTDLAAHFKSAQPWLPAEFIVGVPLPDGPAALSVEVMDEFGNWHGLQSLDLVVAADGARSARVEGEVIAHAGGSSTTRVPHIPFHGHLDQPDLSPPVHHGRIEVFGWLLHETHAIRAVFATLDGGVFNVLGSGQADDTLATKVPQHPAARHARVRGGVDAPPTLTNPACLRVYAQLADGSVHLCFARRLILLTETPVKVSPLEIISYPTNAALPALPSGRPRRLLLVVRTMQPDDATLRALDVTRQLTPSGRWATRLVAAEDGPLKETFEASGCAVQIVNPLAYFAATQPAATETALNALAREIWWRHLDGVVIFDPGSIWADRLARQKNLPVFHDPADSIAWFSPSAVFTFDPEGRVNAPIRGLAAQGAGVLLHAAAHLARYASFSRPLLVTDVRYTPEENLFQATWSRNDPAAISTQTTANSSWFRSNDGLHSLAASAVVCPAFTGHPHRTLLSALAAGVPLITTPSRLLAATFGVNEVTFVAAGNPLALAHAIIDTLANPADRERRTAAAARLVATHHSPALQLLHWERGLEAVIGG